VPYEVYPLLSVNLLGEYLDSVKARELIGIDIHKAKSIFRVSKLSTIDLMIETFRNNNTVLTEPQLH
jgi:hypothetical protein